MREFRNMLQANAHPNQVKQIARYRAMHTRHDQFGGLEGWLAFEVARRTWRWISHGMRPPGWPTPTSAETGTSYSTTSLTCIGDLTLTPVCHHGIVGQ